MREVGEFVKAARESGWEWEAEAPGVMREGEWERGSEKESERERDGGMVGWMDGWRNGGMEGWRDGGMEEAPEGGRATQRHKTGLFDRRSIARLDSIEDAPFS